MNKSNSIMEKMQEYQAPKCEVMELQNEGMLCMSGGEQEVSSTSSLEDYGAGSMWGSN